jgi:hypothetical protein
LLLNLETLYARWVNWVGLSKYLLVDSLRSLTPPLATSLSALDAAKGIWFWIPASHA